MYGIKIHIVLAVLSMAVLGNRYTGCMNYSVNTSQAYRHTKIPQSTQSLFLAVSAIPVPDEEEAPINR